MRSGSCTQVISCEPSPHFNWSNKDWSLWLRTGRERWGWRFWRVGEEREGGKRKMKEEEVEGRWSRTMWLGEVTSSNGSHSWGTE